MLQQPKINSLPNSTIDLLIKQWLNHRQEVLVHYSQLSAAKQNQAELLQQFCEILMDYIAAGHFRMFEKLAEFHQASPSQSHPEVQNLLKKILLTTDVVLEFNDKYTESTPFTQLPLDLSHLGESLANRMDWEDEFIQQCLKVT